LWKVCGEQRKRSRMVPETTPAPGVYPRYGGDGTGLSVALRVSALVMYALTPRGYGKHKGTRLPSTRSCISVEPCDQGICMIHYTE